MNGIVKGLYSPESGRQIKINQLINIKLILAATLRWFTAGGAIRIAVQLSQTWKLRHYDVIDDVITRKL